MLYCVINAAVYECDDRIINGYEIRFSDFCVCYVPSYAEAMDIVELRGAILTTSYEEVIS